MPPGAWWAPSPRVRCTFSPPPYQPQFLHAGGVRLVSVLGSWSLAATFPAARCQPSQMSTIQNLLKSLVRNWKPVCSLVGDAISGAEIAPFPSPCLLPPAGDGLVHCWLALLWNCSVFLLFLSNATRSSLFSPHLLVADASVWGTFLLGDAFRHVICGFYLFFLPVMLPSEIWKLPPDPPVRGFPGVWKLALLWLPSQDGFLSLALLSLFLSFMFFPTSFRRQWPAFLGAWCPLLAIKNCFAQIAQHWNVLSMNL